MISIHILVKLRGEGERGCSDHNKKSRFWFGGGGGGGILGCSDLEVFKFYILDWG